MRASPGEEESSPSVLADGYAVLARLVAEGITPETLELASLSPRLAAIADNGSAEELAADHCHVFDLSAPPFEGLVMDTEARVGNLSGQRVRQVLEAVGVVAGSGDEPEHLAVQLGALARLCAAEASAASIVETERAQARSAMMLDHLLGWILPYEAAVLRCERALPSALLVEIVELVIHHRGVLGHLELDPQALLSSPARVLDLDARDTDLRAIATFLIRPAASGLVLTRDDISRLGRRARVPRGFGDRALLLHNLLRNAAGLGELAAISRDLEVIAGSQLRHVADRLAPLGASVAKLSRPWSHKLAFTTGVLVRLRQEASRTDADADADADVDVSDEDPPS